jgi:hypothetical protein
LRKKNSKAEIAIFEKMDKDLSDYNKKVGNDEEHVLDRPLYSPDQMAEYSRYRELLTAKELEEDEEH